MSTLWTKIRAVLAGRRAIHDDLSEEIETHLEMEIDENLSQGMGSDEARRAAQREFGNASQIKESAESAWRFSSLEDFMSDVAYASRAMYKAPIFAAVVILTLAFGIGGNTAVFTLIRDVLLKPLPYAEPEQLVRLRMESPTITALCLSSRRCATNNYARKVVPSKHWARLECRRT